MSEEDKKGYNDGVRAINAMNPAELDKVLREGNCPYPVQFIRNVPIGMHHCPVCGTMVVAGLPHHGMDPPWDPGKSIMAAAFYEQYPDLAPSAKS